MAVVLYGQGSHACCPAMRIVCRERKHAVYYFFQLILPRFSRMQFLVKGQLRSMQGVFAAHGNRVLLRVPVWSPCFATSVEEAFDKSSLSSACLAVHVLEHLPEAICGVKAIYVVGFLVAMCAATTAAAWMIWR